MSRQICSKCGTDNNLDARFCLRCGSPLSGSQKSPDNQASSCPRCGTILRLNARFCPNCGLEFAVQTPIKQTVGVPLPAGSIDSSEGKHANQPPARHTQLLSDVSGTTGLVVRWMGGASQEYPIIKSNITIGRAPDNDLVINHPAVSGHHIRLDISGAASTVMDLKSTNGTQLNGATIPTSTPTIIKPGDILRIGDLTGNWVSLAVQGKEGEVVRSLSLGKLDLSEIKEILIGRDPECYLPLNHPTVSFHHAQIFSQNGSLAIRDLNSTNGTFVNGKRIAVVPLSSGDEIQIGPFKLMYDAAQQSLAQSMRLGHRIDAIELGREVAKSRMILSEVSMTVNPGEFIALVGGSGAGKSTLLKAMNGYEPANHGQMLLDGEPLYGNLDLYRTQMGYVPQDDIIHRALPVKRALWYAAKLRLPDARPAEIEARIQDALRSVEMTEHADKPVRVLSGGQRKRVSIAVELLAHPTLFFLDEPTSGLDPELEKKMMYDLNRLADEGRTVVLVTHATANIEQCDHVAFLTKGWLSYYGPPNEALSFFGVRDFSDIYLKLSQEIDPEKGKTVPEDLQPYYGPKMGSNGKTSAGVLWAKHYRSSNLFKKLVTDRQKNLHPLQSSIPSMTPTRKSRDSFLRQTGILARRQFDLIRFDWRTLFILLLMLPMLGMLFAMVSKEDDFVGRPGTIAQIDAALTEELEEDGLEVDEKVDYLPMVNAQLLVTMVALALTQGGTFGAAYEIVKERAIFKREKAVNLKATSYVLSKLFVLGLFALFQVALFLLAIGFVVDFGFNGAVIHSGFLELYISLTLAVVASIAFGLFISAIVPSQDVVLYAILAQLFVQIVLSGTMFPLDNSAASLISPGYWATVSAGSTIDIPILNEKSRVCSVNEIPNMQTGAKEIKVICNEAVQEVTVDYEHSEEFVLYTWIGMFAHILIWTVLTIFVQARKKVE